jgi:hypothetical protein
MRVSITEAAMTTAASLMAGIGEKLVWEMKRIATAVERLIEAMVIPTIAGERSENSGYRTVSAPVIPRRITVEIQSQK